MYEIFVLVRAYKNFVIRSRNFFVHAIAKHVVPHRKLFSQAVSFGRSQNAESIKTDRIGAK